MLSHIVRGFRLGSVLSLSLLAAGFASPAQAQVKLEHKFSDGRKTVTHTMMKVKQTLTLAGMAQETESERFAISTDQAGKRDADGKIRIEKKTDKLSVNLKIAGMEVTFDSDDPSKKAASPMLEPIWNMMRTAIKLKPVLVRDKSGKVVAVEGLENAADGAPEEFRGDFEPEKIKKTANQDFETLPSEAIKPGATWAKESDMPLGGGQTMTFTTDYKYIGEVQEGGKKLDKIEAKVTAVSLTIANNPMVKLTKCELKPTESTETLLFDREAGEQYSSKSKTRIQGVVDLEINGMAFPGKLDLTIEIEAVRQP